MEALTEPKNEIELVYAGQTLNGLKVWAVKREFHYGPQLQAGHRYYWTSIMETPSRRGTMAYISTRFYGTHEPGYDMRKYLEAIKESLDLELELTRLRARRNGT